MYIQYMITGIYIMWQPIISAYITFNSTVSSIVLLAKTKVKDG